MSALQNWAPFESLLTEVRTGAQAVYPVALVAGVAPSARARTTLLLSLHLVSEGKVQDGATHAEQSGLEVSPPHCPVTASHNKVIMRGAGPVLAGLLSAEPACPGQGLLWVSQVLWGLQQAAACRQLCCCCASALAGGFRATIVSGCRVC